MIIIIAGLGNPGEKFKNTPHNIGFLIVEEFARKNEFPEFRFSKKYNALITESFFENKKILLFKPQSFMNNSGDSIKRVLSAFKKPKAELWVVHDEADIDFGKTKITKNRGPAGHKGVESIIKNLKTKKFIRFRVGIRASREGVPRKKARDIVIKNFSKEQKGNIKKTIIKNVDALEYSLKNGLEKAMWKFNH